MGLIQIFKCSLISLYNNLIAERLTSWTWWGAQLQLWDLVSYLNYSCVYTEKEQHYKVSCREWPSRQSLRKVEKRTLREGNHYLCGKMLRCSGESQDGVFFVLVYQQFIYIYKIYKLIGLEHNFTSQPKPWCFCYNNYHLSPRWFHI